MVDSEKLAGKSLRSTLSCLAGFFSLESSHVISTAACLVQFLLQWGRAGFPFPSGPIQ